MASANSSVLSVISSATAAAATANAKLPVVKVQQIRVPETKQAAVEGRRAALFGLAAVALTATAITPLAKADDTATAITPSAKAGVIEEYLEKSKANKELNDKKRLATSGANFARAYTVEFGTCKFPYNFTGCQDLAKQKKVPFISDDLEIECEGKEKYKCGSNVFWKW